MCSSFDIKQKTETQVARKEFEDLGFHQCPFSCNSNLTATQTPSVNFTERL